MWKRGHEPTGLIQEKLLQTTWDHSGSCSEFVLQLIFPGVGQQGGEFWKMLKEVLSVSMMEQATLATTDKGNSTVLNRVIISF